MQVTQIKQEPNPRQTAPIVLSLTGNPTQNNCTPMVFRPIKDNGSTDYRPTRTFEPNPSNSLSSANLHPKRPSFEIKLPYPNVVGTSAQAMPPKKPFSFSDYPCSIVFSPGNITAFFQRYMDEIGVKIPGESMSLIISIVVQQLHEILLRAAQVSRQRTNVYMPPIVEREITSAPMIKHHFLSLELYYSNKIRCSKLPAPAMADMGKENYEPCIFKNFEANKADIFSTESFNNEWHEQRQQNYRIFQSMKQRGVMFKPVAHESDPGYPEEIDKILVSLKIPAKTVPFNPKAQEIFGSAPEEEKKIANRKITPKDIFEALRRMPKALQSTIPELMLEYFGDAM